MVFTTHFFVFYFLPTALGVYYLLPFRFRSLFLTLISYVFYGWGNPKWIGLLLFSTAVDYCCGLVIGRCRDSALNPEKAGNPDPNPRLPRLRTLTLIVSIVTNLGLLGAFKYFDFFAGTLNVLATETGLSAPVLGLLHLALPVGISFYTFQSMSYTIDIYRGQAEPLRNPIDFACYVALFPQLVAGPIVRYRDIAGQMRHRVHSPQKFAAGTAFFMLGFAKKILIANPMAIIADAAFGAGTPIAADAWTGLGAYTFQIYFDFSGYSEMAIGLGLMLGFAFPKNFDAPYRADSITDFWRRWHISLSSWLRDYLYIPLGGNRKGQVRTYANLAVVMLLGGLWHGASWNFVVWGGLHGGMLAWERRRRNRGPGWRFPRAARIASTFGLVCLTWVFFRADSLGAALAYLGSLFGLRQVLPGAALVGDVFHNPYLMGTLAAAALLVWRAPQTETVIEGLRPWTMVLCFLLFLTSIAAMWSQATNPFLYFQF